MQAGNNVLVDGSLRNWEWYVKYFARRKEEYSCAKISILHVDAPREAIIQRAKHRGVVTGRKIPQETLEMAIKQVPVSISKLKDQVDSYYKLNNSPNSKDVELMTEECKWEKFKQNWIQTCAWIPTKGEDNNCEPRPFRSYYVIWLSASKLQCYEPIFSIMKWEVIYLRTYCTKFNVALPYIIY